jgi:hypothetical protein
VRALVERAAQEWRDGIAAPRLAAWKASQSGVEETLLHPLLNMPCPAADVVRAFLGHIRPALASSGDEEQVILEFARIITSGTGSHWQRETMLSTQRLTAGVEPPSWSRRRGAAVADHCQVEFRVLCRANSTIWSTPLGAIRRISAAAWVSR